MRTVSGSSRWLLLCLLAMGIFGAATPSPAPPLSSETADPEQAYRALDSFLQDQLDAVGIPGAAVAVVRDGVQVHSAAFGRADESGRPMTCLLYTSPSPRDS